MRKKTERGARESAIASGWTVEADPAAASGVAAAPGAADPGVAASGAAVAPGVADPGVAASGAAVAPDAELLDPEAEPGEVSNAALVLFGVFGGLYLLYAWGWFVVAQAYSAVNAFAAAGSGSLGGVLQQIVFWAAPLAPPLWFLTALVLSRGGRTRLLAILLIAGAVLLLPLPMLIARGG